MSARLSRITLFPVKSLDGVDVGEVRVNGGAGLDHDREYRLADADGATINGKRVGERLIRIRSSFDLAFGELRAQDGDDILTARLPDEAERVAEWFGDRIGFKARVERDAEKGFPDDEEASGPTVISRATLAAAGGWFGVDEDEMRRRIRANLEIDGVPAFWEDRLYGTEDPPLWFRLGETRIEGVNPCARCTVPTRDSRNGEIAEPKFAKLFAEHRRETLPDWAEASRFDHFYRLAVNTRIPEGEGGKVLSVGDELRLEAPDDQ